MDNFLIFTRFILAVAVIFTMAAFISAFVLYKRRKAREKACPHELSQLEAESFRCVKCGYLNKRDGTEQII
jgi:hypothetical protein